ncbi:MAG: S8 family serine peptidase [Verrucomicrobia bacterium]|nr:S8 family serine peptidase [Verrucomicrobiota bacterium]
MASSGLGNIYRVPDFPFGLVRVDRVYRSDQAPQAAGKLQDKPAPQPLWENAMIADHLMVKVRTGLTEVALKSALPKSFQLRRRLPACEDLYLVEVPMLGDAALEKAIQLLESRSAVVEYAEPDFVTKGAETVPNDPIYAGAPGPQWHLPKIQAPVAWDVVKQPKTPQEANSIVVAVIDTGVDYTHPDLAENIWSNPNDFPGNGDDDNNDFDDDIRGWDFIDNDNNPMDDVGHGTHVAGIIGALGNNGLGVAGVCWQVKILPIRIIRKTTAGTFGTYSAAVPAMIYIKQLNRNNVRQVAVANHSWGGAGYSKSMLIAINNPVETSDAKPAGLKGTAVIKSNEVRLTGLGPEFQKIRTGMTVSVTSPGTGIPTGTLVTIVRGDKIYLSNFSTRALANTGLTFSNPVRPKPYGIIHAAAAGNKGANNDLIPTYPASTPSGFIISVGATDATDARAVWAGAGASNYGALTVDLFAPGSGIWSTRWKRPTDSTYGYESRDGTSMAAPLVSGTAALLTMWQPEVKDARQIRQLIVDNVDPVPSLAGQCMSGGRLNLARILDKLYQPLLVDSGGSTGGTGTGAAPLSIGLSLSGQVAKGDAFTLAIKEGQVWAWGWGYYGQVPGAETAAAQGYARSSPVAIPDSEDAVMVAATGNTAFMLKSDGTVWAWGGNSDGLLATGSTDTLAHPTPVQISGLWQGGSPQPQAVWISAGGLPGSSHVTVVNADGSVWAWGKNGSGQLGDGTTTDSLTPVQVPGLLDVAMTAVGSRYTVAMKSDGTVLHWGKKLAFSDTTLPQTSPLLVPGISNASYIAAGLETAYVVMEDGSVKWWGTFEGDDTQTGYPPTSQTPAAYHELTNIVAITAGNGFALGVDDIGRVFSWGRNDLGQLGTGSPFDSSRPQEIAALGTDGVGAIASGRESSIALLSNGEVMSWGRNQRGELGIGRLDETLLPVQVPGISGVALARAGRSPAAAVRKQDGSWLAWGFTGAGPLSQMPAAFTEAGGFRDLKTSWNRDFVLAQKAGGGLVTWGAKNEWGEFGNNTTSIPNGSLPPGPANPVTVQNVSGTLPFAVSPGANATPPGHPSWPYEDSLHCLAVNTDGTVRAWGRNHLGQLGDGSTTNRARPVTVSGLTGIVAVAAGGAHSLALKNDGTVWAWGNNHYAQLGDGTVANRTLPVRVSGLTEVVQIAAYREANVALRSNGSVWVWGIGGGVTSAVSAGPVVLIPTQVPGVPALRRIEVGSDTIMGIDSSGDVWAWSLYPGLLGRFSNSLLDPWTPAHVEGISQITELSVGEGTAFAVRADGSLWAWGNGESGFLGDGSAWTLTPQFVIGFGGTSETTSGLGSSEAANSWQLQRFSAEDLRDPEISDDTADPDGDRLANLLEFALGLDPLTQDVVGLPEPKIERMSAEVVVESRSQGGIELFATPTGDLEPDKDYFGLSVPRQGIRQGIEYIVEVSTDLISWTSGDATTITLTDNAEQLLVFSTRALNQTPVQYIRLRVQRDDGSISATSPIYATDLNIVKQATFALGSSIATEADGSAQVKITLQPPPTSAITLPLTFSGTAVQGVGKDYVGSPASVTFATGETEKLISLTLLQDNLSEPVKTLRITLGRPADVGVSLALGQPSQHVITLLDDETKPKITAQPLSQLVPRGSPLSLAAGFVASPAPTFQWLLNNKNVGRATKTTYSLTKAETTHAGTYALSAKNVLGTVLSDSAMIGIVDTAAKTLDFKPGATTTLTIVTAGPSLSYRWHKDSLQLTDGGIYSGTGTPALKLTGMTAGDSGRYHCLITMGELTLPGGTQTVRVMDQEPDITEPLVIPNRVVIGSSYGPLPLPIDSALNRGVVTYSATGLPPGIVIDSKTGILSGRPIKLQTAAFNPIFTARNLVNSDIANASITVLPLPANLDGGYQGYVERHPTVNGNLGGRLSLTVTPLGSFSGILIHGSVSLSFKGSLDTLPDSTTSTATVTVPTRTIPVTTLTLALTFDTTTQLLTGSTLSIGAQSAQIHGWRLKTGPLTGYPGYYTLALTQPSAPSSQPRGAGYGSFTVDAKGGLKITGKLAHGILLTSSANIGAHGEVLLHQTSTLADTVLGGLLITPGAAVDLSDTALTGTLTWSRVVQKTAERLYQPGFGPLNVTVFGGRYLEPQPTATALVMGLSGGSENTRLAFDYADFGTPVKKPDTAVTVQAKGAVTVTPPAESTRKTSLTVTPKTGLFKGSLTLSDINPTAAGSVARTSAFEGLIVRQPNGLLRGHGFFVLDDLPTSAPVLTTPKTSPKTSGRVWFRHAADTLNPEGQLTAP